MIHLKTETIIATPTSQEDSDVKWARAIKNPEHFSKHPARQRAGIMPVPPDGNGKVRKGMFPRAACERGTGYAGHGVQGWGRSRHESWADDEPFQREGSARQLTMHRRKRPTADVDRSGSIRGR